MKPLFERIRNLISLFLFMGLFALPAISKASQLLDVKVIYEQGARSIAENIKVTTTVNKCFYLQGPGEQNVTSPEVNPYKNVATFRLYAGSECVTKGAEGAEATIQLFVPGQTNTISYRCDKDKCYITSKSITAKVDVSGPELKDGKYNTTITITLPRSVK